MRRAGLVLLTVFCAAPAMAGRAGAAADFLRFGVGARALGLGGAYTAAADDASAVNWNPAGLTALDGFSVTAEHAPYVASTQLDYAAAGSRWGRGGVGASVLSVNAGDIARTDATGADIGRFTPRSLCVSAGAARDLGFLSLGASGKWVVGSSRVDLQACKLEYSIVSPK